jgi:hypothetical protein
MYCPVITSLQYTCIVNCVSLNNHDFILLCFLHLRGQNSQLSLISQSVGISNQIGKIG